MGITTELKVELAKEVFREEIIFFLIDEIKETLINGNYVVNITKKDKFTISEIIINFDNYEHHYFGLSAKHPKDDDNSDIGEINATKNALRKMMLYVYSKLKYSRYNKK